MENTPTRVVRNDALSVFDRFFNDIEREFGGYIPRVARSEFGRTPSVFPIDVEENPSGYTVHADLPGVDPANIELEMKDDGLTIAVKQESKKEEKDDSKRYLHRERQYITMTRRVALPDGSPEEVHASFKNGVLTVNVGREKSKQPKKISISAA
jgi:HSP20 family protein